LPGKLLTINATASILSSPIEYLKGVGPQRADLLKKELSIFTYNDLLNFFPYRHIDKTQVYPIGAINMQTQSIQVRGRISMVEEAGGEGRARRLMCALRDGTGELELVWFQGVQRMKSLLKPGNEYIVFGKIAWFNGRPQITHPEMEPADSETSGNKAFLEPVYPTTEKLKQRFLTGRAIGKMTGALLPLIHPNDIPEFLPSSVLQQQKLMPRYEAYLNIHFPKTQQQYNEALRRLKFEELFIIQVRLNLVKIKRHRSSRGNIFSTVGNLFNTFYQFHLPFQLTGAQKRVLREIRTDCGSGHQMNRLLQGDVGSGKTVVALLSMLLAADNGFQSCLMAPTEILARQHYTGLSELLKDMPVNIEILTGSTPTKERKRILAAAADGSLNMLIGTHALIEDTVQFANLGLAVVDEQHRFGVEQRASLWKKNTIPPHVLVMTATPIPRTLAMTAYGDLDYSIMDELPPGRQPILTVHRKESSRANVLEFVREEIALGRQAYIIFPLIEESETLAYENLMRGYENIKAFFPEPKYWISMVHGKMDPEQKEINMRRFVKNDTQIMVSTTVIEVGVNVPNASVMVIESSEKFGLSQLHQLRGRVGRGKEKSYCILITGNKLTQDARERIKTMCETTDGFKIAEKDLELRGPGDIEGTRQSGTLNFKLASIINDRDLIEKARRTAEVLIEADPELETEENSALKSYLLTQKGKTIWSKIS
jgi:ATP-dependent DNA helicase RecG